MKQIALAAVMAALSAVPILAQTTPKSTAAAGLGKVDASSNVDRNIRAYIELLRADVKTSKSQILGEVMQLDADQATKFWPIYKEFETGYARIGDRIVSVVMKYADEFPNLTEATADQLGREVLNIEQERNALKKTCYDRMKQSLGGIVALRFLQVENQLERIVDLQVAAGLPIVEGQ